MADVSFPARLRLAIQESKRREQEAGYRQSDPAGGPPYFEAFSDDVPTTWEFNLRFNRADASYFWSWVKSQINNGRDWFNMKIGTEHDYVQGIQEQEVHFTAGGFPRLVSERNQVLTYRCEVIAREIALTVSEDLIFQFHDTLGGDLNGNLALDRALNIWWPSV